MKDSELDQMLKSVRVPDRPEEYWDEFPGRVSMGIRRGERARPVAARRGLILIWCTGAAGLLLLLGFAIDHWRGVKTSEETFVLAQNEKLIREMLTLFPQRVRAIMQDEQGMELVLSE
jgi:hypothetical protein